MLVLILQIALLTLVFVMLINFLCLVIGRGVNQPVYFHAWFGSRVSNLRAFQFSCRYNLSALCGDMKIGKCF